VCDIALNIANVNTALTKLTQDMVFFIILLFFALLVMLTCKTCHLSSQLAEL